MNKDAYGFAYKQTSEKLAEAAADGPHDELACIMGIIGASVQPTLGDTNDEDLHYSFLIGTCQAIADFVPWYSRGAA